MEYEEKLHATPDLGKHVDFYYPALRYAGTGILPKVTIVIPVYNVEKYLRKCLDSAISQTLPELEIICVNDGSPDGSLSILEEYRQKDDRIAIISQENRGLSAARNIGMKVAQGKYIYFMDSDDWIALHAMETLYAKAEENQVDIVTFGAERVYEIDIPKKEFRSGTYLPSTNKQILSGEELIKIYNKNGRFTVNVWIRFFRKDFLAETGICFYEGILQEDVLFSTLILLKTLLVSVCTENLYYHFIRKGSIMRQTKTHRNVEGYFITFACLLAETKLYTPGMRVQRDFLINGTWISLQEARRIYAKLSDAEKDMILQNLSVEYQNLYREVFLNKTAFQYNVELFCQFPSFFVRRFFTYVLRKIRGLIRSFREHGYSYTFHFILGRMHLEKE